VTRVKSRKRNLQKKSASQDTDPGKSRAWTSKGLQYRVKKDMSELKKKEKNMEEQRGCPKEEATCKKSKCEKKS